MTAKIESAMILAAGLGTRLKPLTLDTPKPLLPLDGKTLIEHQLAFLSRWGVKRVAINLHHLGHMIRQSVGDGQSRGLEIFYSEEPRILGTGGGVKMAARFFGRSPFIVLNADALIAADIERMASQHIESGGAATIAVKALAQGDLYTPLSIDELDRVTGFGVGRHFFTGLSVMGPEIFDALPQSGVEACLVKDGLGVLIERKQLVESFLYEGYFNDLGTPERYEQAKKDIESGDFKLL